MIKIKHINSEVNKISGLTFDKNKLSLNGIYCPELTAKNIRKVHEYVVNDSSYSSDSGDNFIQKYFSEHKGDTSPAAIMTKVILIDTVDSTNLKQLLGKDYYKIIAKRICENDIEKIIKVGGKFGEKFKAVASYKPKKGYKKDDLNLFIFFSKYITRINQYCYNRNDYSILDSVVRNNLKYLQDPDNSIIIPAIEQFRTSYNFDGYCDIFKPILRKYPDVTREMIDHFIWFTFKEEAVGDL